MDIGASSILLDLYGSINDPPRLTRALDRLCTITGSKNAIFQKMERRDDRLHRRWLITDAASRDTIQTLKEHDDANPRNLVRFNPIAYQPCILEDHQCQQGCRDDLTGWQDMLARYGFGHFLGIRISLNPSEEITLALHAPAGAPRFDAEVHDLLGTIITHGREAVLLAEEARREASLAKTLGQPSIAPPNLC